MTMNKLITGNDFNESKHLLQLFQLSRIKVNSYNWSSIALGFRDFISEVQTFTFKCQGQRKI